MKPTLLILAAGLSSRYKLGLKQIDRFGPSGEILLDYAVYDAIKAGFGKVVFVIQKSMYEEFEKEVSHKYQKKIKYDFAFQELDDLPDEFICPDGRQKPWGTGHAVWVAENKIQEPFAIINADDYYGPDSFKKMAELLSTYSINDKEKYAMIGYILNNTLSDYGAVSRGICSIDDYLLQGIVERTKIQKQNGNIVYIDSSDKTYLLKNETIVSMNFWGFTPDIFSKFEKYFCDFLVKNIQNNKSEFLLPVWINDQIKNGEAHVKVLTSSSQWVGVTYPEDKPEIIKKLKIFIDNGDYPSKLF